MNHHNDGLLAIARGGRELVGWTASRILDLCEMEGIEVPVGRGAADEKAVGRILSKCFVDSDVVEIDDMVVTRRCFAEYDRENRKERERKEYAFSTVRPMRPGPTTPGKNVSQPSHNPSE